MSHVTAAQLSIPVGLLYQANQQSSRVTTNRWRTWISTANASAIFFLWIFCAAVTSPFSGVHSSAVKITACRISMDLNPFFLPIALHSFQMSSFTFSEWHNTDIWSLASMAMEPVSSACLRLPSWGIMMAIGCWALADAWTHMLPTRLQALKVASRRSRATY